MKRLVFLCILILGFLFQANSNQIYSQNVTVTGSSGANGSYSTLKAAFDELNANSDQTGNTISIMINANTTETETAVLYDNSETISQRWLLMKIFPTTTGVSVSGALQNLVVFSGCGNIIINGSEGNNGSNRDLTFLSTYSTGGEGYFEVIEFQSMNTEILNNITVKNCIISGSDNSSSFSDCILFDCNNDGANQAYYNNVLIQNNQFKTAACGINVNAVNTYFDGNRNSNVNEAKSQNFYIYNNLLNSIGDDALLAQGMELEGIDVCEIRGNKIGNFIDIEGNDDQGIYIGAGCSNVDVWNNEIYNLGDIYGEGYGAVGIDIATGMPNPYVQIFNNLIYNIYGDGYHSNTAEHNPRGIWARAGNFAFATTSLPQGTISIEFNTINMYGGTLNFGSFGFSAGIVIEGQTDFWIFNNNIVNTMYSSDAADCEVYGIVFNYSEGSNSDYNNIYVNPNGSVGDGGAFTIGVFSEGMLNLPDLEDWQDFSTMDMNSLSVDPIFTSLTNLHINGSSPLVRSGSLDEGSPTEDFDNISRQIPPTIGAYEIGGLVTPRAGYASISLNENHSNGWIDNNENNQNPSESTDRGYPNESEENFNGWYSYVFDGSDCLQLSFNSNAGRLNNNSPKSLFLYFRPLLSTSTRQILLELGGSTSGMNAYIYSGKIWVGIWNSSQRRYFSKSISANNNYLLNLEYNGTKVRTALNGLVSSSMLFSGFATNSNLNGIGCSNNGTRYMDLTRSSGINDRLNAQIAEILLYNSCDQSLRDSVMQFIDTKYNQSYSNNYTSYFGKAAAEANWDEYESEVSPFDNNENVVSNLEVYKSQKELMINLNLDEAENIEVAIFDMNGIKVGTISNIELKKGINNITYSTNDLISGVYFVRAIGLNVNESVKVNIVK